MTSVTELIQLGHRQKITSSPTCDSRRTRPAQVTRGELLALLAGAFEFHWLGPPSRFVEEKGRGIGCPRHCRHEKHVDRAWLSWLKWAAAMVADLVFGD